ncbi:hypothetical protein JAAARDRAFT_188677 [Jaapia argillacea MUCL 33604]|uniref:Uncharacterized protein n=1 Tax=Jaapia argillacea MUCL 33604 TaxID=933084 RepID=A0A067Q7W7_9AGAM|nr:hypothetical protein JAAARDRAFT_188677 [Jaapia argillacea MUCL 33604]
MATPYYFTVDDTSAFLNYTPFADGDLIGGWQTWYTGTGLYPQPGVGGDPGAGDSYHNTSHPGASVSMNFFGTGITLYGQANCSYQVTVDSQVTNQPPNTGNVLFTVDGLTEGTHFVTLTALPTAGSTEQLAFDNMILMNLMPSNDGPLSPTIVDNTNTAALTYYGSWTSNFNDKIPNSTHPSEYHETKAGDASVAFNFTGTAVVVNGTANWGNWVYEVSLDGQTMTANGSTWWIVPDSLLFYKDGLDPNTTHLLNVTNVSDQMNFWLNTITVYKPATLSNTNPSNNNGTHKSTNPGVIAGPIVAAVVVIAALIFGFFWWRRSPKRVSCAETGQGRDILGGDDEPNTIVRPFYPENLVNGGNVIYSNISATGSGTDWSRPGATIREKSNVTLSYGPTSTNFQNTGYQGHESRPSTTLQTETVDTQPMTNSGSVRALPSPPPQAEHPPVDVDRIVEMVAQRIDRSPRSHDPSAPPPEYRG